MTLNPNTASAAEIANAVGTGSISACEVIDGVLAAIRARNKSLNAFTAVTEERARAKAAAIDAQRAQGGTLGALAGVPFAAKNLVDVAGVPTLAGSKINREHAPATRDATLIE